MSPDAHKPPPPVATHPQPSPSPSPSPSSPSHQGAVERLRSLAALVDKLATTLTCSICLDLMHSAHQLQCSHIFCPRCVTRMLSMCDVRCPICKQKTGKRMLSPLISFEHATQTLHALRHILRQCDVRERAERQPSPALNDGFDAALSSAVCRIRQAQREQRARVQRMQHTERVQRLGPPPVCALCPKGVDPSFFPDTVRFGQFRPAPSTVLKHAAFAHENCAMYSDGMYQLDDRLVGLDTAIVDNCNVECQRHACGRKRASVSCASASCSNKYHFACAVVDKCVFVEDGYKMFCPQHANEAPAIDEQQFTSALSDPKGNLSLAHDDTCYICLTGGRLLMCDTCERCTHPACSALRSIPDGSWSCGVCTGKTLVKKTPVHSHKVSTSPSSSRPLCKKRRRVEQAAEDREGSDMQLTCSVTPSSAKRPRPKALQRKKTDAKKRMVLSHTGLQEADREFLRSLAKSKKTILKEDVDGKVTHLVIRCCEPTEKPLRTMKLCKAIASRARIVCWTWVEESHNTAQWAPFERHLHQLSWAMDKPCVYANLQFSFGCYNGPREKKEDLTSLVVMGGGTVVQRDASSGNSANAQIIHVREEEAKRNGRREQLSRMEPPRGARVVTSGWLLDLCTKNRMEDAQ